MPVLAIRILQRTTYSLVGNVEHVARVQSELVAKSRAQGGEEGRHVEQLEEGHEVDEAERRQRAAAFYWYPAMSKAI